MSSFVIVSGNYETGTTTQQSGYRALFGAENTKDKFDLYFHWFNIVHETAHCLIDIRGIKMDPVGEEIFVNCFAVEYWKAVDFSGNLAKFHRLICDIQNKLPKLLPDGKDFSEFFREIYGSEQMNTVEMYGYFQVSCIEKAFRSDEPFGNLLKKLSIIAPSGYTFEKFDKESFSKEEVLSLTLQNMSRLGISDLDIKIEAADNPELQCCRKNVI